MADRYAAAALGAAIRRARVDANLTQADVGEFLGGLDRHVVAALERGVVTTQVQRLLELLDVLGLELNVKPRTHGYATAHVDTDAGTASGSGAAFDATVRVSSVSE
jgi:HTH-type transcriptional regulator/antitoxin HipB